MSRAEQKKRSYAKTQDAPLFMQRWEPDDVDRLMHPNRSCDRLLSRVLGRSVQAIQVKRCKEIKRRRRETSELR